MWQDISLNRACLLIVGTDSAIGSDVLAQFEGSRQDCWAGVTRGHQQQPTHASCNYKTGK